MVYAMDGFAPMLRALMSERGLTVAGLARQVPCDKALISRYRSGRQEPSLRMAQRIDDTLGAAGQLAALARGPAATAPDDGADDEIAALELARRAAASDVGTATVERLERAVDMLATAYPGTPPAILLPRVRRNLGYVSGLVGARATLAEHGRLLTAGGWLSLLAATSSVDLGLHDAAAAHLATAAQLAHETGHAELAAWCLETRAWQALTAGDYRQAVTISQAAQRVAPDGSSAQTQATAQEGRAWARIGDSQATYAALRRVESLVSPLPVPADPEHHYPLRPGQTAGVRGHDAVMGGRPGCRGICPA
jgi:transcriptional regulator with XRE-family HTH domain